jgi:asparagine synthase (glutamine-hydrolysing)
VVGYLYQKYGDTNELWNSLDGIFACVIWDERTGYFCAARDPIGICSLYWGRAADGSVWFASEMKALQAKCDTIDCFPPVGDGRVEDGFGLARRMQLLLCVELVTCQAGRGRCGAKHDNVPMICGFPRNHLQGHVYRSSTGKLERWFQPDWINLDHIPKTPADLPLLKVPSLCKLPDTSKC